MQKIFSYSSEEFFVTYMKGKPSKAIGTGLKFEIRFSENFDWLLLFSETSCIEKVANSWLGSKTETQFTHECSILKINSISTASDF